MSEETQLKPEVRYTPKQLKWLKHYIQTGNAGESARLAGYNCKNDEGFYQIGYENLRKLEIPDIMEEIGLSKKNLLQILAQNVAKPTKKVLKRTITKTVLPKNKTNTFYKDKKGRIIMNGTEDVTEFEYEDAIDYPARNKALEVALKLQNALDNKEDKEGINIGTAIVQVVNYGTELPKTDEPEVEQAEEAEVVAEQAVIASGEEEKTSGEVLDGVEVTSYAGTQGQRTQG